MQRCYVAIDDTDQAGDDGQGKGTGAKSRALAKELVELVGGSHLGITRHQLLLDAAIPYTSHNSSACIVLGAEGDVVEQLVEAASVYLDYIASAGADVGLCVGLEPQVSPQVVDWGRRAKAEVLTTDEAHEVARDAGLRLHGLTGDRSGVIGALAACGLRRSGEDGRFLELAGLRRLTGEQPAGLFLDAGVERFLAGDEEVELGPEEVISVGHRHAQPVLLGGRPTLLLDPGSGGSAWRVVPRELVKQY
jgi:hypothetical protein